MAKGFKLFLLTLVIFTGCKKPYNPPAIISAGSFLVVEGVIDPGNDTTIIRLTKTVNLSSGVSSVPVLGGTVSVSSDGGGSYSLAETGKGYYKALLQLNGSSKYQLKINALNNTYTSDFVPVKSAAPIDTVGYSLQTTGVSIYLSTHDPSNNSRYYRWTFSETYIIHSAFDSELIVTHSPKDTALFRPFNQQIYQCWVTDTATTIILGSSAKLAQDVISNQPITTLASTAEKLGDLYSIQVKQYAVTTDAFNYYQQLKKNTEQLGSIFDAQPSELTGNIHCTSNPSQIAIGYITAGTCTKKRIFIDSRNLPANYFAGSPYAGCRLDTFLFKKGVPGSAAIENQVAEYIYPGIDIPVGPVQPPGAKLLGYSGSDPSCIDCTLRGTNIKPSFWP